MERPENRQFEFFYQDDQDLALLGSITSGYACQLVFGEYKFALTQANYEWQQPFDGMIFMREKVEKVSHSHELSAANEVAIDTTKWSCSCLFMTVHQLPCRHVLFLRKTKHEGCDGIIPLRHLHPRWILQKLRLNAQQEDHKIKQEWSEEGQLSNNN